MAFSPDYRTYPRASAATTAAVLDAGLRAYMLRVYNWMSSGLLLTGIVAYAIANTDLINAVLPRGHDPDGAATHGIGAGDDLHLRAAGLRAGAEHGGEPAVAHHRTDAVLGCSAPRWAPA